MFRMPGETVGEFWQRKVLLTIHVMGTCCYLGVLGFSVYSWGMPVSEVPWFFWIFVVGMVLSGLVGPSQLTLSLLGGERRYAWINVVLGLALTVVSGVLVLFMPFSMLNVLFLVTGLLMWFRGMRILMGLRRQDEVVRV